MNTAFVNIIRHISSRQGEAILGDPARLKVFIHSQAAGVPVELRRAFGRCIETGCYDVLKQTRDKTVRARIKPRMVQQVQSISHIDAALCAQAVDILEAVIYDRPFPQFRIPRLSVKKKTAIISAAAMFCIAAAVLFAVFNSAVAVFEPLVEFNGEEYPSKIIATAATDTVLGGGPRMIENDTYIGDALGDLGVKLRLHPGDKSVRVEIEGNRLVKKSSLEIQIETKKSVEIFPYINYNWTALEKLEEPYIENIQFRLYIDGKLKKEAALAVPFHTIHDEPFWDASRNGNKTLSNYHFVVVIRETELIERELERIRLETEQRERQEAAQREAARLAVEQRDKERREAARLAEERARREALQNPYNDKRVRDTLAKVHANIRDVNGDGQTNCVDYSNLFYYYSPFKYSEIVVNYNPRGPQGGMNHQFNVVRINGQLVYIEPQSNTNQSYDLKDFWGAKYNPAYNQIQITAWLYLPRGQTGTEE